MDTITRTTSDGNLTVTGAVTSDGFVTGSASCVCGWHVGPGALLGTVESVDAIDGHNGCSAAAGEW